MVLTISFDKFLQNLDSLKQNTSSLRVLYKPADIMTVDQFVTLQGAKLKMEFVPMPDMKDEALSSGYLIGRLTAETTSTILVTDAEQLLEIGSIPAKGTGTVYFVKDIKQAQKLEKSSSVSPKKRVTKKEPVRTKEKRPVTEEAKEKNEDFDGFMNLPEDGAMDKEQEKSPKVQAFLKKELGAALADKYYDAIAQSAKKAEEYVGWEVLLRVSAMNREDSAKIYEKLSPKFKELKALL